MVFPHEATDWAPYLQEARRTFVNIIEAIRKYQKVLLVCADTQAAKSFFDSSENIEFVWYTTDDTWARDMSAITVEGESGRFLYDFVFNAWGGKFDSARDNAMTRSIREHYGCAVESVDLILEGGGIESNGRGVLLTTAACMLNPNRNVLSKEAITSRLKELFGLDEVLYLHHGYLAGDDTDSHIDTLARFVDERTIMYVKCDDESDEHYAELKLMEAELEKMALKHGFRLIALPFCEAVYFEGERLPATYANFLMINGAVLVPTYNTPQDAEALAVFKEFFKERRVIGIDCSVLIRQHGSLHCVTMQFHCGL